MRETRTLGTRYELGNAELELTFLESGDDGSVFVPVPDSPFVFPANTFGDDRRELAGVSARLMPLELLRGGSRLRARGRGRRGEGPHRLRRALPARLTTSVLRRNANPHPRRCRIAPPEGTLIQEGRERSGAGGTPTELGARCGVGRRARRRLRASWPTSYADPAGDVERGPDITSVRVSKTETTVTFTVRFATEPPLQVDERGWIDMLLIGVDVPPVGPEPVAPGGEWRGADFASARTDHRRPGNSCG